MGGSMLARLSSMTLVMLFTAVRASGQSSPTPATGALPGPTGPYAVGTHVTHLSTTAVLSPHARLLRPMNIQLWYPAQRPASGIRAQYFAEPALIDSMVAQHYLDTPPDRIRSWAGVGVHAWTDARAAQAPHAAGWPMLVFAHGFGVARAQYTALCVELASHGYVVLLVDDPYGGFALAGDGHLMQAGGDSLRARLAADSLVATVDTALAIRARLSAEDAARAVRFVARTLPAGGPRPVLDTTRVGMLGHSLGGAAALEACRQSPLFRACADMDGAAAADVERTGVPRPYLVLLSQPAPATSPPRDSAEAERRRRFAQMGRERDSTWAAIRARHADVPAFVIKLMGTAHFSFSDAPFTMPEQLVGVGVNLTPREQFDRVRRPLLDFFDHFLRGRPLRSTLQPTHLPS